MQTTPRHGLRRYWPETPAPSFRERMRSATGALLGILVTGLIGSSVVGFDASLPALIAPMGASAVLLFAVPASPLAQPWSIIGGNTFAALVGVTASLLIDNTVVAAARPSRRSATASWPGRCSAIRSRCFCLPSPSTP